MFTRLLTASVTVILLASGPALCQMFTDFKPGGTVPKNGYTPDPNKVMYVLFWHHKKRTNEFDHRAYYMNDDGVNKTTADKMKKMIEERYPNLAVYVKETNERDIRTVIEREQKRIKFIEKDWVDLKQPEKIEPPKMLGRARFGYDESLPKTPTVAVDMPPKKVEEEPFSPAGKYKDSRGTIYELTRDGRILSGGEVVGKWSMSGMNLRIDFTKKKAAGMLLPID